MGMPVTVEVIGKDGASAAVDGAFAYLQDIDRRFSTYRADSEISALNAGRLAAAACSGEMREVLALCEETRSATRGYFDIRRADGMVDPSGLVKGWALRNVADRIAARGFSDFYVDGGGDVEVRGRAADGGPWSVGIRHPFQPDRIVKVLRLSDAGIATSGTYLRGTHIYDPTHGHALAQAIASLTVIGPNVYDADRFATAAFAMGEAGIGFVESLDGFEGYMIDNQGMATMTTGFVRYTSG